MLNRDGIEHMYDMYDLEKNANEKTEALNRKIRESNVKVKQPGGNRWIKNIDEILEEWRGIQDYATEKLDLSNCYIDADKISGEIMNVDFHGSTLPPIKNANLTSCDFSHTEIYGNIRGYSSIIGYGSITETNLTSCDFSHADLTSCKITETNMNVCCFKETEMLRTDMKNVSMHGVDFSKAKLINAVLTGITFEDCFFLNTEMSDIEMRGCIGKGSQTYADTIQVSFHVDQEYFCVSQEYAEKNKREIYRVLVPEKEKDMRLNMIQRMKEESALEVHYIGKISEMTELTLKEARVALQDGIRICYPDANPETEGRHSGEYQIHEIKGEDELENIYHAKGKSAVYKAYIYPGYEVWMNMSVEKDWKGLERSGLRDQEFTFLTSGYEDMEEVTEKVEKRLEMEEVKDYLAEKAACIKEEKIKICIDPYEILYPPEEILNGFSGNFYRCFEFKKDSDPKYNWKYGIFQIHNPDMQDQDMKIIRSALETGMDEEEIRKVEEMLQEHFKEEYDILMGKAEKIRVALESSEDYTDIKNGLYTQRNLDPENQKNICRCRMVRIGKEGMLEPYPNAKEVFYNQSEARVVMKKVYRYIIEEVPYDTLVQESLEFKNSYEKQIRNEISGNITKSGFAPTDHMIKNIQKLNHLTGQKNTLKDIMNLHKKSGADIQPNVKKIVESVADECRGQEQAINMYRQRMVQMNTVQAPAL